MTDAEVDSDSKDKPWRKYEPRYKARKHLYYLQHKEEKNRRAKELRLQNPEVYREMHRKKRQNPEYRAGERLRQKMYRHKTRMKLVVDILGGKCVKCGMDDFRVLQIDHSKADGKFDQSLFKNGGTPRRDLYYIKNKDLAVKHLQILCANCNIIKSYEGHERRHYFDVPLEWTKRY